MKTKSKNSIILKVAPIVIIYLFLSGFLAMSAAAADIVFWGTTDKPSNVPTDIRQAVLNITNYVLGFVAIIATLMVVYGGVLYLTSLGNEEAAATARRTIANAIIGIFLAGLAYAMVQVITGVILVT